MSPHTSSAYMSTISPGQFYSIGSPTIVKAEPFQGKLLAPSIRVYAGCRGGYNRDVSSPSDYVILVRKEQDLYYNVVTGRQQPSSCSLPHQSFMPPCPMSLL